MDRRRRNEEPEPEDARDVDRGSDDDNDALLRNTTVETVHSRLGATQEPAGPPCLLTVRTPNATELGRVFDLANSPVSVGRLPANDVVIDDGRVSRVHCRFERSSSGDWSVVDCRSTNGTRVNGRRTSEARLVLHDHIQVGSTELQLATNSDERIRQMLEVLRSANVEPVTGLWNRHYLDRELRRLARKSSPDRPLTGAVLWISRLKDLVETYGHSTGDDVLRHAAGVLSEQLPAGCVLGRLPGAQFLFVFPGTAARDASVTMGRLLDAVRENPPPVEGSSFDPEPVVGVAELPGSGDPTALLGNLDAALALARRRGERIAVIEAGVASAGPCAGAATARRLYDGRLLVDLLLGRQERVSLLLADGGDDSALVAALGRAARDELARTLLRIGEKATGEDDRIGLWRSRYLVVALAAARADATTELMRRLDHLWSEQTERWQRGGLVERRLSWAQADHAEIRERGPAVLAALASRCRAGRQSAGPAGPTDLLPFPLAAVHASLSTCGTAQLEVKALVHVLETGLRFVVAAELSVLAQYADPECMTDLAALLHRDVGPPLTLGRLERLAWQIARLMPADLDHPVADVARALCSPRGRRSKLAEAVRGAVELRNRSMKQVPGLVDDAYADDAARLRVVIDLFIEAMRPLAALELVSYDGTGVHLDDSTGEIDYPLRLHAGPSEQFPLVRRRVDARFSKGWCYLLHPGRQPTLLAPLWFAGLCEQCRRIEVFAAHGLTLGSPGSAVSMTAVISGHETRAPSPRVDWLQRLREAVAVAREGGRAGPASAPDET